MEDVNREARVGSLVIQDGRLVHRGTYFGDWELNIADVRLIAEATDDSGPYGEDWFLVFATDRWWWYEVSLSADPQGLPNVFEAFGIECKLGLARSTDLKNQILYPAHLYGHHAFEYRPARGLLGFLRLQSVTQFSLVAKYLLDDNSGS